MKSVGPETQFAPAEMAWHSGLERRAGPESAGVGLLSHAKRRLDLILRAIGSNGREEESRVACSDQLYPILQMRRVRHRVLT